MAVDRRLLLLALAGLAGSILLLWSNGSVSRADASPAFTAESYPVTVHGSAAKGIQKFNTEAGAIECEVAYHAETGEALATLALSPTFSGCESFKSSGFNFGGSFTTTGCKFQLESPVQTAEDKYQAGFGIACEAGKAIQVVAATCELEILPQSEAKAAEIVNDTSATPRKDITFKPELKSLPYKVTKDSFGCPFNGTGSKTGSFTTSASTTLTGTTPVPQIGIDVG